MSVLKDTRDIEILRRIRAGEPLSWLTVRVEDLIELGFVARTAPISLTPAGEAALDEALLEARRAQS